MFTYDDQGWLMREDPLSDGRQSGYYTVVYDDRGRRVSRIWHVPDKDYQSETRYRFGASCISLPDVRPLEEAARSSW